MAYVYRHFISQNTAPHGAKSIGVYDQNGKKITDIPLGRMNPPTKEKAYSFGLVSDIHFYKKNVSWVAWNPMGKFDDVLTHFEGFGCVFCVHCGDITQTGLYDEGNSTDLIPEQFANYKEVCDKHTIPVYGICGNHESYVVPITNNLAELKYYTGTDLTYTIEQGNDLFILIGQPHGSRVMSDDALQWLYETLEANRNRRCFVFIHPYIEEDSGDALDVRENSIFDYWGTTKTTAFMNLLQHYKNTVLFHGHSHMKLQCQEFDINANYTEINGFRSVHVPSSAIPRDVAIERDEDGNIVSAKSVDDVSGSQGYTVDVYDDCIVLNGWDFINVQYVPLGVYKIDTTLVTIEAGTFTDSTGIIEI